MSSKPKPQRRMSSYTGNGNPSHKKLFSMRELQQQDPMSNGQAPTRGSVTAPPTAAPRQLTSAVPSGIATTAGATNSPYDHVKHIDGGTLENLDNIMTGDPIHSTYTHLCIRTIPIHVSSEHPIVRVGDHPALTEEFLTMSAFSQDELVIKKTKVDGPTGDLSRVQIFKARVDSKFNRGGDFGVNVGFLSDTQDPNAAIEMLVGDSIFKRNKQGALQKVDYSSYVRGSSGGYKVVIPAPPMRPHGSKIPDTVEDLKKGIWEVDEDVLSFRSDHFLADLLEQHYLDLDMSEDAIQEVTTLRGGEKVVRLEVPAEVVTELVEHFSTRIEERSTVRDLRDLTIEVHHEGGDPVWDGVCILQVVYAYI
ncbi:MAG: hypothetical protein ACTSUE_05050 [Promethearchaeota archaeon]